MGYVELASVSAKLMVLMGAKGFGRFEAVLKAGLVFLYVHEKNCLELAKDGHFK